MLSGLVELPVESSNNLLLCCLLALLPSNHFSGELCEEKACCAAAEAVVPPHDMQNIAHVRISANVVIRFTSEILSGVTAACAKQFDMLSYFLHEAHESHGACGFTKNRVSK